MGGMKDFSGKGLSVSLVTERGDEVCRDILLELPQWFGIPSAVDAYAAAAGRETMIGCAIGGTLAGIAVLRSSSAVAADLHVLAVRPHFHRRGVGRRLVEAAKVWARNGGRRFLTVKTLGPSRPSEEYAATRRFYEAVGFLPLEELEGVWPGNPCLLMLLPL